jgi:hypothetical protein
MVKKKILPLIALSFIMGGCSGSGGGGGGKPTASGAVDVFKLRALNSPSVNYASEFTHLNYTNRFTFENTSYRTVDGVKTEDIDMPAPTIASRNGFGDPITVQGTNPNPLCNTITTIPAGGRCDFILPYDVVMPAVGAELLNVASTLTVNSAASGETFEHEVISARVISRPTQKIVVGTMSQAPLDYAQPFLAEVDGITKGQSLGKINLADGSIEYVGSCELLADGSVGDPRGVYPFTDDQNKTGVRVIGNKVLFIGRGCSHDGSSLQMERWGLWEYDSEAPKSSTNPRRISRNTTGSAPSTNEQSRPENSMLVLNNKLYYVANSEAGSILTSWNNDRRSVFEYDPSQPFVQGTNPKEIITGNTSTADNSTMANSLTTHNGKVYFIGDYFVGVNETRIGVIEFDPALPIEHNNPDQIETTDNPRLVWGLPYSQYYRWDLGSDDRLGMYVDDEIIAFGGNAPANLVAPNHANSGNGKELIVVRRSDNKMFEVDLCAGACEGRPRNIKRSGDNLVLTATVLKNGAEKRAIVTVVPTLDGSSQPEFLVANIHNINAGEDEVQRSWEFRMVESNGKLLVPLLNSPTTKNLFEYDAQNDSFLPLFSGNHLAHTEAFNSLAITNDGKVTWKHRRLNNQASVALYDPTLPQTGASSIEANANYLSKMRTYTTGDLFEDANYYYAARPVPCTGGGDQAWFVEVSSKNQDFPAVAGFSPVSGCGETSRRQLAHLLIVRDI